MLARINFITVKKWVFISLTLMAVLIMIFP